MSSKAVLKRYAAMQEMTATVYRKYETPGSQNVLLDTPENRKEIAELIRPLAELGRTDRWKGNVEAWASAVEDNKNTLGWAFLQYSVYTGYAAE